MRIINTTDIAKGTGVKVIGIGEYRVMPGESIDIPDEVAYISNGGKREVLPAIAALSRTHQIRYEEGVAAAPVEPQSSDGAPAGDGGTDETGGEDGDEGKEPDANAAPELTDEEKKALAAKKRADARAAKKAAEEAAKAAAAGSAE